MEVSGLEGGGSEGVGSGDGMGKWVGGCQSGLLTAGLGGYGLGQAGWRACAHLTLRRPSTVRSSGVNCVCESCGICLSRVVRCILSVLFT